MWLKHNRDITTQTLGEVSSSEQKSYLRHEEPLKSRDCRSDTTSSAELHNKQIQNYMNKNTNTNYTSTIERQKIQWQRKKTPQIRTSNLNENYKERQIPKTNSQYNYNISSSGELCKENHANKTTNTKEAVTTSC